MQPIKIHKWSFTFRELAFFFVCVYALTMYMSYMSGLISSIGSLCLAGMLGCAILAVITTKHLKINPYIIWYIVFIIVILLSLLYAKDAQAGMKSVRTLFVTVAIGFSFTVAIKDTREIEWIFACLVVGSAVLMLYMIATGQVSTQDETNGRFGGNLAGNANVFAAIYMAASCASVYFLFSNKKKFIKVLTVAVFILQLYALVLSGGRKYILVPFIMIYLMLIQKRDKNKKYHVVAITLVAIFCLFVAYQLLMSVPFLYDNIGYRFEDVILYESGKTATADASAMIREDMREQAIILWAEKPIFGHGLNMFSKLGGYGVYAHNNFLELMCNNGVIGTAVYYSFYIYIVYLLVKNKQKDSVLRSFFISFVACELFFEVGAVTYDMVICHIFLMLGCLYACNSEDRKPIIQSTNLKAVKEL